MPSDPEQMLTARFYFDKEKEHLSFAPFMVSINPYTSEVVSSRFWGEFVMTWIYNLHYQLLLDKTGRIIMSIVGFVVLVSLITGVYLWWSSRGKLKTAFSFKRNASQKRFNFDLHKLNGIYWFPVLVVIVFTGFFLDLPPHKSLVETLSPLYKPTSTASIPTKDAKRILVDDAVIIATTQFPDAVVKWVETPDGSDGSYSIRLWQSGEPSRRFPKTYVWINQYSGQVLSVRDAKKDGSGDTFLRWLHPLHNGEAFGISGRIIVFLSGFIPLILFTTGMIRWIQKKRVKLFRDTKK